MGVEVVDGFNIRMIEPGESQRFFAQALAGRFVGDAADGKNFDGHVAIETLIASAIDNAHAASANLFGYKIVSEPLTDHCRCPTAALLYATSGGKFAYA